MMHSIYVAYVSRLPALGVLNYNNLHEIDYYTYTAIALLPL